MTSPACLPLIQRLIGFDTTSRNSNLALIDWVRDYLADHGVDSRLSFGADRAKANLFATTGPADRPGLALSGHSDVVPVDGQAWASDPFAAEIRDGRLYGRGSADMKSFLGAVLALVPRLAERPLAQPVHLALSFDEEVGCLGVRHLIADLAAQGIRPAACIVGEPTEMRVVTGHKGKVAMHAHVHGLECHSSLPEIGVNAVEAAAEAIAHLKAMARRHRSQGPFDHRYDPPYTTIHTGTVNGGTAINIVPKAADFRFEFRHIPADDPEALLAEFQRFCAERIEPEMKAVHGDAGFAYSRLSQFPGLDITDEAAIVGLATDLTGANGTHRVAFGTEAGLFHDAGIPTVICGPGSIEQAHKPDEFIELDQIRQCEAFLDRLLDRVRAPG